MKDAYGNIAKWYDNIFEPLNSGLRKIGMKLDPPEVGMQVLDIGCGTGAHLLLYQNLGCEVYGVDTSPAMLAIARNKLGSLAKLIQGDASKLPYQDNTFDLVMSTTVLHELTPQVRSDIIEESMRVVKEEGRILYIDFHPGPIKPIKGWLTKLIITLAEIAAGRDHFNNYRVFIKNGGLIALANSHGLSIENKRVVSGGALAVVLLKKK